MRNDERNVAHRESLNKLVFSPQMVPFLTITTISILLVYNYVMSALAEVC